MRIPRSIRWRLQLWLGFWLVCVLSGFGVTAYQLHRLNVLNQIDRELERRVAALGVAMRPPPPFGDHKGRPPFERGIPGLEETGPHGPFDLRRVPPPFDDRAGPPHSDPGPSDGPFRRGGPEGRGPQGPRFGPRELWLPPPVAALFEDTGTNDHYFAVWSAAAEEIRRSTNAPADLSTPSTPARKERNGARLLGSRRELFHFTERGECILVGRSAASDLDSLRAFARWLFAAGGGVLALGLGGGWWLTTKAIKPVEDISAAASRISAGHLSERIAMPDTDDELGRLAGVLNSTFDRLEKAFTQQKQLTADAAHELRTPLAVLITEAQTALARPRNAEEYRETVEGCLDAAQQMRRLTESLLELARFEAGEERVARQPVQLAELAGECVECLGPLAREGGVSVACETRPAEVLGDADWLGQVAANLLRNAIHHTKPGGEIRVATRCENGTGILTVADTGSGIQPEDLPHIFERFYRGDKSRARATGRYGLGLAISKAIVDAHGGDISVSSAVGVGTTFTVSIPIAPATDGRA